MRRRLPPGAIRLKYLNRSGTWPSGNPRYYYRPPGEKGIALPDLDRSDPRFREAYEKITNGKAGGFGVEDRPRNGTIAAAVKVWKASDDFKARAVSTRETWDRMLSDIVARYGVASVATLSEGAILIDLADRKPFAKKNRLKVWRAFCAWLYDEGRLRPNPAAAVKLRPVKSQGGFTAWTQDDVDQFRRHWPIGSKQRLAFELAIQTGASIGEVVSIGPANVRDGWLTLRRGKTKTLAVIPFGTNEPDWFVGSPFLWECLAREPRHMTFVTTQWGGSRSKKGAASWFSEAATAAGLPADRSCHGIRKYLASRMKERGASKDQRMAILGHVTEDQEDLYSASADLRKVIQA